jgi:hypothetical protein
MSACASLIPPTAAAPSASDVVDLALVGAIRWNAERVSVEARVGGVLLTVEGGVGRGLATTLPTVLGAKVVARILRLSNATNRLDVLTRSGRASFSVTARRSVVGASVVLERERHEPAPPAGEARDLGDYRLEERLGEEDGCVVHRALHRVFGRVFALKVPRCETGPMAEANLAIVREARALGRIDDPRIARPAGIATAADGRAALVLELPAGETLADVVAAGPLAPERALAIARSVAGALAACHVAGVAHGRIGLATVRVRPDGGIVLTGFGAAREADPEHVRTDLDATRALLAALGAKCESAERARSAVELEQALATPVPTWRKWLSR